jgi:Flp pilus assembly protein TadG
MAVIMPVLIVLVLLPIHVALWWHAKQVADLAAEEAVDAAQVEGAAAEDGKAAAEALLRQAGHLENVTVTVSINGDQVVAEVRGESGFKVVPGRWAVLGRAEGRVERFIGEQER